MLQTVFHGLTTKVRTRRANRQLGGLLAFVAGAVNAGGFLVRPFVYGRLAALAAVHKQTLGVSSDRIARALRPQHHLADA